MQFCGTGAPTISTYVKRIKQSIIEQREEPLAGGNLDSAKSLAVQQIENLLVEDHQVYMSSKWNHTKHLFVELGKTVPFTVNTNLNNCKLN